MDSQCIGESRAHLYGVFELVKFLLFSVPDHIPSGYKSMYKYLQNSIQNQLELMRQYIYTEFQVCKLRKKCKPSIQTRISLRPVEVSTNYRRGTNCLTSFRVVVSHDREYETVGARIRSASFFGICWFEEIRAFVDGPSIVSTFCYHIYLFIHVL